MRWPGTWSLLTLSLAALLALPVFTVLAFLIEPWGPVFAHLASTVLPDYIRNSLVLMTGVGCGVLLIGVSTAWLTASCQFPGRALFEWALLLPLAVPGYIIAYTYTGMLGFEGALQSTLRSSFDWRYGDYWFPEIRSMGGAVFVLTAVLYPYVYMLARTAFLRQSVTAHDVSRSLGHGPASSFWRIALPMARPAIVAGLSLALMETLADYGTVQYFGVVTFTTGIFRTWFGFGDSAAAARLAGMLLGFIFTLIVLERYSRRHMRFSHEDQARPGLGNYLLQGWRAWAACLACLLPLLLGFVLPALQLLSWSLATPARWVDPQFIQAQGVEEVGTAKGPGNDDRLRGAGIVVDDVVGSQQDIDLATLATPSRNIPVQGRQFGEDLARVTDRSR